MSNVETAVLAKSARRCTLCFRLNGDLAEKLGQITHLDDDPSNRAEDNLAWMCLEHHSLYDSKTKQHKNYTINEVKEARTKLYKLVAQGKHLTPAAAQPALQPSADHGLWQRKSDAYTKLLEVSYAFREGLIDICQAARNSEKSVGESRKLAEWEYGKAHVRYHQELAPALAHEVQLAAVFLGCPAVRVLKEFLRWSQSEESGTPFEARVDFITGWRTRISEAARKDLGVPEDEN